MKTVASPKELGMLSMINLVKDRLMIHVDGKPRIMIFNNCRNIIQEIKKYKWGNNPHDEKPSKGADHALDALRYCIGYLTRYNKINR